jgi:putative transcriptional regulator
MDDYEFKNDTTLTIMQLAESTEIHRATLSKMLHERGCNVTTDVIDRLCTFFGVPIQQLMEHLPSEHDRQSPQEPIQRSK